jgi:hypothetical protein
MRVSRLSVLAFLAAAACTQTPTHGTEPTSRSPVRPTFDGLGLGSGHVVPPPAGGGETTTTAAVSGETTTATDSTTNGRGGLGLGSGH